MFDNIRRGWWWGRREGGRLPGSKGGVLPSVNVSVDDEKAGSVEKKIKMGLGIFHQCPTPSVRPSRPQNLIKDFPRDLSSRVYPRASAQTRKSLCLKHAPSTPRGSYQNETPDMGTRRSVSSPEQPFASRWVIPADFVVLIHQSWTNLKRTVTCNLFLRANRSDGGAKSLFFRHCHSQILSRLTSLGWPVPACNPRPRLFMKTGAGP
jgi:hypothetical protein